MGQVERMGRGVGGFVQVELAGALLNEVCFVGNLRSHKNMHTTYLAMRKSLNSENGGGRYVDEEDQSHTTTRGI